MYNIFLNLIAFNFTCRAYKMRASDNEGTVAALEARLNSKDALVEDLSRKVATFDGEAAHSTKKQSSAIAENNALKTLVQRRR